MKKRSSVLLLGLFACLAPSMSGCSSNDDVEYLRILNAEDYMLHSEIESEDSLLRDFEEMERENGRNVKVVYDTFDTIESMLSSLDTSKAVYDLICPSDYAVEKLIRQKRLRPFDFDSGRLDDYNKYCSPFLRNVLDNLTVDVDGQDSVKMGDYCVGYMWGTLGIVYNPEKISEEKGIDEDQIKIDMNNWGTLWNPSYKGEMSIKDSMRDTYSVGVMYTFDEEIKRIMNESGCFDEYFNLLPGKYNQAISYGNYNDTVSSIFNRCDESTTKEVQKNLLDLKKNVYGFECDSGKDDVVKGYIGINLAWSGDAVYSLDRGENEANNTLYYSLPKTGGNIWFDSWIMPESEDLHQDLAEDFVNFISIPSNASLNMQETGYTSFIGGDDILDLIRSWYDPRSYAMYVWHDDEDDWESSDFVYDEDEIVYRDGTGVHSNGDDYGEFDMRGSTYEHPIMKDSEGNDLLPLNASWSDYQNFMVQYTSEEEEPFELWDTVNLTYMFEGSISDERVPENLGTSPETNPYLFYTDELEKIEVENSNEVVTAGRQFYTQYPDQNIIPKLCVMRDFKENNKYVLSLWENVKSDGLPSWGVIVFASLLTIAGSIIVGVVIVKNKSKKIRRVRKSVTN